MKMKPKKVIILADVEVLGLPCRRKFKMKLEQMSDRQLAELEQLNRNSIPPRSSRVLLGLQLEVERRLRAYQPKLNDEEHACHVNEAAGILKARRPSHL